MMLPNKCQIFKIFFRKLAFDQNIPFDALYRDKSIQEGCRRVGVTNLLRKGANPRRITAYCLMARTPVSSGSAEARSC